MNINICTVTWKKDSHDLFDYESTQVKVQKNSLI